MKVIVTGAGGTIGSVLVKKLMKAGFQVVTWDRTSVPVNDPENMFRFLNNEQPDAIFHLAVASEATGLENEGYLVNVEWPAKLAEYASQSGFPFIFTSSVMVFTNDQQGPFTPDTAAEVNDGYGYEKRLAEERLLKFDQSRVLRIGWQIGEAAGSNNMVDFLEKKQAEEGVIRASEKWLPACSLVQSTADALMSLLTMSKGLYLFDQNRHWNFYEIVVALRDYLKKSWNIESTADFVYDQRMIDERIQIPKLDRFLQSLGS